MATACGPPAGRALDTGAASWRMLRLTWYQACRRNVVLTLDCNLPTRAAFVLGIAGSRQLSVSQPGYRAVVVNGTWQGQRYLSRTVSAKSRFPLNSTAARSGRDSAFIQPPRSVGARPRPRCFLSLTFCSRL